MDQRLNFVTLAVADTTRSRAFYVDGLSWAAAPEVPGEVIILQVAHGLMLSLWNRDEFTSEVGEPGAGLAPITLAHNVDSPEEVDAVLTAARAAGAPTVADAVERDWGGYSGYFADPDGFRWEVATNPGDIGRRILAESKQWLRGRQPRSGSNDNSTDAP